ncbi:DNA mismatch repair protein MutS [Ponticaulis koreensis]|uniref:DNA mismatch repair protein MutS n=1 Tax=Ponticaulis koreensis TaxID=1123045 RepID=UPI0003B3FCAA|nr:DNA mismatch repair protein MutS [Ponticaulis koreensis]
MSNAVTPFMAQYLEIKSRNPDTMLFFRMGDFYELFFEDAELAADVLDITLTKRGQHNGDPIPMAGVPHHSAEPYLARLIRAGHRVAICEQTETPAEAKKRGSKAVVNRDIVRIVTPGTLTEDTLLEARSGNFLAAICADETLGTCGVALCDISTGQFILFKVSTAELIARLSGYRPNELVMSEALKYSPEMTAALEAAPVPVTTFQTRSASAKGGAEALKEAFNLSSVDGLGQFEDLHLSAAGLLLGYIELTQAGLPPELDYPVLASGDVHLMLDETTRHALEIDRTQTGARKGSLLHTIDRTLSAGGARLLADQVSRPLTAHTAIEARLDGIQLLLENSELREDLREEMKGLPDLERARSRLRLGRATPVDLKSIRIGLETSARVLSLLEETDLSAAPIIASAASDLAGTLASGLTVLGAQISSILVDDPPAIMSDGGFVRSGANEDLDRLRTLRDDSRKIIAGLEAKYQQDTGISAIRIKFNAMLGYFLEVPAKHVEPFEALENASLFHRRQGLANATRYSTEELANIAREIDSATTDAKALELKLFAELVNAVLKQSDAIRQAAIALSQLDVSAAGAEWADEFSACRPQIFDDKRLHVTDGRHPVVEAALRKTGNGFVSNSLNLGNGADKDTRLQIITGPNMAGKSTFLRQTALLVILAQAGWYVPAREMQIGIVDRVFSRVGASDDLARGKSTFMVEMLETASILNQASDRALVILDEVGRGTSTYDGLAIAWSCVEYLHDTVRCRGLFATHYHELTKLATRLPFAGNLSLRAREWRGDLIFLHEVQDGPADKSYGVQVARLAGLPKLAVQRAKQVLDQLETVQERGVPSDDLPLFSFSEEGPAAIADTPSDENAPESDAMNALAEIDPDEMSPKEALDALYHLKGLMRQ